MPWHHKPPFLERGDPSPPASGSEPDRSKEVADLSSEARGRRDELMLDFLEVLAPRDLADVEFSEVTLNDGQLLSKASKGLFSHAVDTFGSDSIARQWFSIQCGAMDNRTPLQLVESGQAAEVERILDCIDYGMLA